MSEATIEQAAGTWLEDSKLLRSHIAKVKDAHRPSINEGATYLALNYNRPANALSTTDGAQVIGFDGLKELGFGVMAESLRASKTQVVQPLQPRMSPIGGTHETLQACEGLSQVVDGVFDFCDFTDIMGSLFMDGGLCGEGYGLIDVDPIKKDFYACRLDPLETFFNHDRAEGWTTRMVSRRRALAWLGTTDEKRAAIKLAPKYKPEHLVEVDSGTMWDAEDNIALFCGWAEPIGDVKGKFVIQVNDPDGTVLDEGEWDGPVPIFSFPWDYGHRGQNDAKPLGRTIAPLHYWINEMVRKMHDALKASVPIVKGPKDPQLSDVPYQFVEEEIPGTVTIEVPKTVSQDVRQAIVDLREQVYRETGQSEEAAAGAAPPQYKSAVALSTWKKIVNESMGQQHRNYARAWTQAARIICWRAPKVYESKKARALARGTDVIDQIDFSKVALPEGSYSVAFDVVSELPKHLPDKLNLMAFAEEKGWVDGDEVLTHINIVDFRAAAKRRGGPRALMNKQISRALATPPELIAPSEMQDCQKLAELAGQAYQAAQAQHIKPPRQCMQTLLHLYLLAKARAQPSAPAAAPAPAMAAPALTPEVAPPLPTGTEVPPAEPLPIV